MRIRPMVIALLLGGIISALGLVVLMALGGEKVFSFLLIFGMPMAYVIDVLTPTSLWYWIIPEGGGPSAALLFALSVWLQSAVIFGATGYMYWRRQKSGNATATKLRRN